MLCYRTNYMNRRIDNIPSVVIFHQGCRLSWKYICTREIYILEINICWLFKVTKICDLMHCFFLPVILVHLFHVAFHVNAGGSDNANYGCVQLCLDMWCHTLLYTYTLRKQVVILHTSAHWTNCLMSCNSFSANRMLSNECSVLYEGTCV